MRDYIRDFIIIVFKQVENQQFTLQFLFYTNSLKFIEILMRQTTAKAFDNNNSLQTPISFMNANQTTLVRFIPSGVEDAEKIDENKAQIAKNHYSLANQNSQSALFNWNQLKQGNIQNDTDQQVKGKWQKIQNLIGGTLDSTAFFWLNLVVTHVFLVACLMYDPVTLPNLIKTSEIIQLNCQSFFCIVIILRLINRQSQFIVWTILEMFLVAAGFAATAVPLQMVKYFKAVRALRLFYFIGLVPILTTAAKNLFNSLSNVKKIIFPATVFIYIFAIIGTFSFSNYEYNRCRTPDNKQKTQNWTVYEDQIFLCGVKQCPIVDGIQLQCLNPIDYGVQPNYNELLKIELGYGLLKYDNVLSSLLSTYKQIFVTGSSRLMVLYKQATYETYIQLYHLSFIYLLSYVYLNIFFGLMLANETSKDPGTSNKQLDASQNIQQVLEIKNNSSLTPIDQEKTQNNQNQEIQQQYAAEILNKGKGRQLSSIINNSKNHLNTHNPNSQSQPVLNLSKDQNVFQEQQNCKLDLNPLAPVIIDKKTKPKKKLTIENSDKNDLEQLERRIEQQPTLNIQQTFNHEKSKKQQYLTILVSLSNFFIVIGCLNMCMDFRGKSENFTMISDTIDVAYNFLFVVCFISKISVFCSTPPDDVTYIQKKYDIILQSLIQMISIVGLIYQAIIATDLKDFLVASGTPQKIIRSVKYLRIFSFMLRQPGLSEPKIILVAILNVIKKIANLILLYVLIALIFSIIGFHLFGYTTKVDQNGLLDLENGQPFQVSFNGICKSLIFTFFTFYNQQWDYLMFQQSVGNSYAIVVWQLISVTFGCLILSKYFMALLVKELSDKLDQEGKQLQSETQKEIEQIQILNIFLQEDLESQKNQQIESQQKNKVRDLNATKITPFSEGKKKTGKANQLFKTINFRRSKILSTAELAIIQDKSDQIQKQNQQQKSKQNIQVVVVRSQNAANKNNSSILKKSKSFYQSDQGPNIIIIFYYKSANILKNVLESNYYSVFRCLFLVIKCTTLALDHPHLNPQSHQAIYINVFNHVTEIYFVIQIAAFIYAFGIWKDKNSYFKRSWLNIIYLILSIIGIAGLTQLNQNFLFKKISKITVLRVIMFLELRYDHDKNMRLTIVAFTKLIPKICSFLFVAVIIFGYFAIILIRLYKDDFFHCENVYQNTAILTRNDCFNYGGDWVELQINVNNIGSAILYLFLVAATEELFFVISPIQNVRGSNIQPLMNYNPGITFFFIVFFFIGNLIVINVFIGLSVYNFKKIKEQTTGQNQLTPNQRRWLSIKTQIYKLQPQVLDKEPQNVIRKYSYKIAKSTWYKVYRVVLIILYTIAMSLMTSNMNQVIKKITSRSLNWLSLLTMPQYFIQVLAFGFRKDHKISFFAETLIVIYTICIVSVTSAFQIDPKLQRVLLGLLVCIQFFRYFTLLNQIPFFRKFLNSILTVIPQTLNIFIIMVATMFVYAIIGSQLFGFLRPGPELNDFDQNYKSFSSSVFSVIKFSLPQSPIDQIIDAGRELSSNFVCFDILSYEDFQRYGQMGCGSKVASYIFFLSFHLIYSLVLIPTLMAVIFDKYTEVINQQQCLVNKFQLQDVKDIWKNYDPQAIGYISYRDFWMFTAQIMKIYKAQHSSILNESKRSFLKQLAIPIYENQNGNLCFQFHEVIQGLTKIIIKKQKAKNYISAKTDKIMTQRQSFACHKLKRSHYNSSNVFTLIILKSGLRLWHKKSLGNNAYSIFANVKLLKQTKQKLHLFQQLKQGQY